MTPLVAIIVALAVYRATVLVTKDYICEPLRSWLRSFDSLDAGYVAPRSSVGWIFSRHVAPHAAYLSTCPWCASIWAAAVLVPLTALVSWWAWIDAALAASAVAGIIFERVNEGNE